MVALYVLSLNNLKYKVLVSADTHGVLVNTLASHASGPGFKSRRGLKLFEKKVEVSASVFAILSCRFRDHEIHVIMAREACDVFICSLAACLDSSTILLQILSKTSD